MRPREQAGLVAQVVLSCSVEGVENNQRISLNNPVLLNT